VISLTVGNTTRSVTAWSQAAGVSRSTIMYRYRQGWTPSEILGFAPPPTRLRQAEQLPSARRRARVLVTDDSGAEIPRHEAAQLLSLTVGALTQRLRRHQISSGVSRVSLAHLRDELARTAHFTRRVRV
jgi:hypothetical protein